MGLTTMNVRRHRRKGKERQKGKKESLSVIHSSQQNKWSDGDEVVQSGGRWWLCAEVPERKKERRDRRGKKGKQRKTKRKRKKDEPLDEN